MNDYSISEDDFKLLNAIWWTLEGIDCGVEEPSRIEDCQEHLYNILDKLHRQANEKRINQ